MPHDRFQPARILYHAMPAETPLEALTGGYWRNYGVTNGTSGVYRFFSDGTDSACGVSRNFY